MSKSKNAVEVGIAVLGVCLLGVGATVGAIIGAVFGMVVGMVTGAVTGCLGGMAAVAHMLD